MNGRLNKLWILSLVVVCVVIAGLVLSRGCESKETKEAMAYLSQGYDHYEAGRHEDAIIAYKKAIVLKPDLALAHCLMPWAYDAMASKYCKLKQYDKAIGVYKEYIAIKPDDGAAYYHMGDVYREWKKFPEAIGVYEEYIAIKPDDSAAYYRMGDVYREWKKFPEAIAAFKRCIAIKPTGYWASEVRKAISELSTTQPAGSRDTKHNY